MQNNYLSKIETIVEYAFLGAILVLPFSKSLLNLFLAVGLIGWIVTKLLRKELPRETRFVLISVVLFVLFSCVSAFTSGYPAESLKGVIKLLKYVLIMLIASDLFREPQRFKRFLVVAFVSFACVAVDSFLQYSGGKNMILKDLMIHRADQQIRLTGPYRFYGLLAAHLIAGLPVLFSYAVHMDRRSLWLKGAWLSFFLASTFLLYKTHSRGAWIGALCSWLLYAWWSRSRWMAVALAAIIVSAPFVLPRNALLHLDKFSQEQTIIERNLLWSRAVQVIQAKPFFGVGLNTYTVNHPKYVTKKNWRIFPLQANPENYEDVDESLAWGIPGHDAQLKSYYAHNGYLQLAAESGLIALAFFLLLIWKSLRSGVEAFAKGSGQIKFICLGLLSGTIALLIHATVDTTLHNTQSAVLIWLFLGILLGSKHIPRTS